MVLSSVTGDGFAKYNIYRRKTKSPAKMLKYTVLSDWPSPGGPRLGYATDVYTWSCVCMYVYNHSKQQVHVVTNIHQ